MGKRRDQESRTESKTLLVEQIHMCLQSGDYARALDSLRGTAADFPNDAQLSELEKHAQDGVKRNAEANCLITQSQELFAQRKPAEAILLLRKAYELDKNNSLARAILANALVEQAHSLVETDWLQSETLTNQALALNPAHPTAKTILGLIVNKKETSLVEDWVSQARKLQTSGDLFAALAWVAEGLAVHPHDPKLLQIQDEIQRDQETQRRQARRGDLDDLRRLQREIDRATDVAAKQALAERIQAVAAKHWTDGEILSIANALLLRLGLIAKDSPGASPRGKGATVILHVPRPSVPNASLAATSPVTPSPVAASPVPSRSVPPSPVGASQIPQSPIPPSPVSPDAVSPSPVPLKPVSASSGSASQPPPSPVAASPVLPSPVPPTPMAPNLVSPNPVSPTPAPPTPVRQNPNLRKDIRTRIPRRKAPADVVPPDKVPTTSPETLPPRHAVAIAGEPAAPPAKVAPAARRPKQTAKSSSTTLIICAITAATILVAATFFFTRKHYAPSASQTAGAAPSPTASTPSVLPASAPTTSTPAVSAPSVSAPAQTTPEPSGSALPIPSDTGVGEATVANPPPVESGHDVGSLLVVAGQDNARIFLNGKLQRQLTQAGQLRLQNLEPKDYVVKVSKSGFQDPPTQAIRVRQGEQARLVFNLQPQPPPPPGRASLTIKGGAPGTTVFVDQTLVGTIQPNGTLSVSTLNPGDHAVELRRERFKSRQFQKHFVAGGTISLTAADAAMEAAPGELKITFAPADAKVAVVKGDLLKMVSSDVPLNLAAGTYTLTARAADGFTSSSTLEVIAGQSRTVNLSLAPGGMSEWEDPGAWKREGDSFVRKGGDFVLYRAVPTSGTFAFSAMPAKGHLLQWVLNYTDPKNYVLFQMDDNTFYRAVIRNGQKTDEVKVPEKGDKKSFRTIQIRVSPTELVHQIKHGASWIVLDRLTQPGANLSLGKFGFYIPGNDQVELSSFVHHADLNIR